MKIESVNNKYLVTTFKTISFIVCLVIVVQIILSIKLAQVEEKRKQKDLNSTFESYQHNISEKLSIITSSSLFVDFLRSDELSRESKNLDMKMLFSNFQDPAIDGISIYKFSGEEIFKIGESTDFYLDLKLCYLSDFLDASLGSCRHFIRINFIVKYLISSLKTMNPNIDFCKNCEVSFEVTKNKVGSFNANFPENKTLPVRLDVLDNSQSFIYVELFFLLILILIFLIVYRSFRKIAKNYIYAPIIELTNGLSCGKEIDLSKMSIMEIKFLGEAINKFIIFTRDQETIRRNASLVQMSTQVAHDIRSPLEMLKGVSEEVSLLPELAQTKIQLSINRIEEIANKLLNSYKKENRFSSKIQAEDLLRVLICVISEKEIEYIGKINHEVNGVFDSHSYGLFSEVNKVNLKSIVSNLINNGIESYDGEKGRVEVRLYSENETNKIVITDYGPGLTLDAQRKIFTEGYTTKKNGNGIGLFSARREVIELGGFIECKSEEGKGTSFILALPRSKNPLFFVDSIDAYRYEKIIILDEDDAMHEVWRNRFAGSDIVIENFYSSGKLMTKYNTLSSKSLFLCGIEVLEDKTDGIDIILNLRNIEHSILVINRSEDFEVADKCAKSNIRVLSKSLIRYIKVIFENPKINQGINQFISTATPYNLETLFLNPSIDNLHTFNQSSSVMSVVLIDDDPYVHLNWSTFCAKKGYFFFSFKTVDAFCYASTNLSRDIKIYIDSDLGNGIKGESESEKIFHLGFFNIYLATGYERNSIVKPKWIKEIYSKNPKSIF